MGNLDEQQAELLESFNLEQHMNRHRLFTVEMSPYVAVAIVGQLQLALRHPDNDGPTREIALEFIQAIAKSVQAMGLRHTYKVMMMGNDPANDFPV